MPDFGDFDKRADQMMERHKGRMKGLFIWAIVANLVIAAFGIAALCGVIYFALWAFKHFFGA